MTTLMGQIVDRPPVSFYELNGMDENPDDPDPYNIYTHPSWQSLIELTREKTDRIVMRSVPFINQPSDPMDELTTTNSYTNIEGCRFTCKTIRFGKMILTSLTRRDPDVNTIWNIEHLIKNKVDLETWISLPQAEQFGTPDIPGILRDEAQLGDSGIVMIDTPDPLCEVAMLMDMETHILLAATEPALFHKALEKAYQRLLPQTEAVARALPGRLWRIYGPEFASPPYLRPDFFKEYVNRYDTPMVETIQRTGGYARIHCHGKIKLILDHIAATGCSGLDPIEPPPQGDVELGYVRQHYGEQMVLFGNLEASDIENLPTPAFRMKIRQALQTGTQGEGRGFVLMPSSCPYGRQLPALAMNNYVAMIEEIERF